MDFWSVSGDAIIIFHRNPRQRLYVPSEVDFPIPLRYVDVQRRTETDFDSLSESTIQYYWNVQRGSTNICAVDRNTIFTIIRPRPPPGYTWSEGRLTTLQETTRPDHIWPEIWRILSTQQKQWHIYK